MDGESTFIRPTPDGALRTPGPHSSFTGRDQHEPHESPQLGGFYLDIAEGADPG